MNATVERQFLVTCPAGLHLRPAVMLSKTADLFDSTISVSRKGIRMDAKSALSIVLLNANFGEIVTVVTQGHDAVSAMAAIEKLFQVGFREQPLSMAV